MPFYVYAWVGTILSGVFIILNKFTAKYVISNPWLFNICINVFILVMVTPIAIASHISFPPNISLLILASLTSTLWNICYVGSIYLIDASVLSPMYNFRAIFAIFLGAAFLHELFHPSQLVYVIAILVAGFFVSYDEKLRLKSFFSKGILLCVLGMLLLATNNMFLKQLQQTLDFWSAFFWTQLLNVIFLIPAYPLFKKDLKKINVRQVKNLFLLSCIALISDAFFLMAYKANVSVTSLIAAIPVSMLMAIGLAFFKPSLLEKHPPKIYALRLFCAAVMIYSALQLSK